MDSACYSARLPWFREMRNGEESCLISCGLGWCLDMGLYLAQAGSIFSEATPKMVHV